jgi:hypothetical protein
MPAGFGLFRSIMAQLLVVIGSDYPADTCISRLGPHTGPARLTDEQMSALVQGLPWQQPWSERGYLRFVTTNRAA